MNKRRQIVQRLCRWTDDLEMSLFGHKWTNQDISRSSPPVRRDLAGVYINQILQAAYAAILPILLILLIFYRKS